MRCPDQTTTAPSSIQAHAKATPLTPSLTNLLFSFDTSHIITAPSIRSPQSVILSRDHPDLMLTNRSTVHDFHVYADRTLHLATCDMSYTRELKLRRRQHSTYVFMQLARYTI